jgi:hypothetical protein
MPARRMFSLMSRKTALRVDLDTLERPARVPSKSRRRGNSADGQLVGEVISIAFDRCEAADAACGARPVAICTGCGTARCADHGTGADDDRCCSTCAATLLTLASAPFDAVLDTRLRLT